MNDYINRGLSVPELEKELLSLISEYNSITGRYLFVYSAAIEKQLPLLSLDQSDYYIFYDLLHNSTNVKKIDIYLETPGGYAEAVEEIVKFLRKKFDNVNFIIAGEAKSAGTIFALSGDEIYMTETGSMGPIDAQMRLGRTQISAHDYMEWVNSKRDEAQKTGRLNPFDAVMVAQITPGELVGVDNALNFAKDLVKKWLVDNKFKNWTTTETRQQPVTNEMKIKRAEEIANQLTNHSHWRSHGRSLKIPELDAIGLKIKRIDDEPNIASIIYKIQVVCRLLFMSSNTYKIFATKENKIFKSAAPIGSTPIGVSNPQSPSAVEITQTCPKCGHNHQIYAKLVPDKNIDLDLQKRGFMPFPKEAKIKCNCGFELDLSGIRNDIEMKTGKRIIID